MYWEKGFWSFYTFSIESVGQRAVKLSYVKLWVWFRLSRTLAACKWLNFLLRPPNLTPSNFAALWATDPILKVLNNLNPSSKYVSIFRHWQHFRFCFWPHFHNIHLLSEQFVLLSIIHPSNLVRNLIFHSF